jgi:hypothetical protein
LPRSGGSQSQETCTRTHASTHNIRTLRVQRARGGVCRRRPDGPNGAERGSQSSMAAAMRRTETGGGRECNIDEIQLPYHFTWNTPHRDSKVVAPLASAPMVTAGSLIWPCLATCRLCKDLHLHLPRTCSSKRQRQFKSCAPWLRPARLPRGCVLLQPPSQAQTTGRFRNPRQLVAQHEDGHSREIFDVGTCIKLSYTAAGRHAAS